VHEADVKAAAYIIHFFFSNLLFFCLSLLPGNSEIIKMYCWFEV